MTDTAEPTARRTRSEENRAHIRDLLAAKYGPAAISAVEAAGETAAAIRYSRCPSCGGYRERAVPVSAARPVTPHPLRGCGKRHGGPCWRESPNSLRRC